MITSRIFNRRPVLGRFILQNKFSNVTHGAETSITDDPKADTLQENYKNVMSNVPQPVVVVTSAGEDNTKGVFHKRGITCSSFTSVSLNPPIVSFSVNKQSRMHKLLSETQKFAIHVLSKDQVGVGNHFARPAKDGVDQFEGIPHQLDERCLPILEDSFAVLKCDKHSVTSIGDHHMWYGQVYDTVDIDSQCPNEPMLYYLRSFRLVGNDDFMQSFEQRSLPFEEWSHDAHLRMCFNYVHAFGSQEAALPHVKMGIWRYNEKNKDKVQGGYHETVTQFYTHMVAHAIHEAGPNIMFEEFLVLSPHLNDRDLLLRYYSEHVIRSQEAKTRFIKPDKLSLP